MKMVTKTEHAMAKDSNSVAFTFHAADGSVETYGMSIAGLGEHVQVCLKMAQQRAERLGPPPNHPLEIAPAAVLVPQTIAYSRRQTGAGHDVTALVFRFGSEVTLCFAVGSQLLRDLLGEMMRKMKL